MKINISRFPQVEFGYKNITLNEPLDNKVSDGECTEIFAPDILNQVPAHQTYAFLKKCVEKMRHGSKLIIGGTDLSILCNEVIHQRINTVDANNIIFGGCSVTSLWDISLLIESFGLKIVKKELNHISFIIEAIRP